MSRYDRAHISDLVDAVARIAAAHAAQILDDLECGLVRWTDNPDLIVEGIGRRIGVWRRMLAQEKADNDRIS